MRLTWVFAVSGLTTSLRAISSFSSFDRPMPTSAITSRSRSVSRASEAAAVGSLERAANSAISRLSRCVLPTEYR